MNSYIDFNERNILSTILILKNFLKKESYLYFIVEIEFEMFKIDMCKVDMKRAGNVPVKYKSKCCLAKESNDNATLSINKFHLLICIQFLGRNNVS